MILKSQFVSPSRNIKLGLILTSKVCPNNKVYRSSKSRSGTVSLCVPGLYIRLFISSGVSTRSFLEDNSKDRAPTTFVLLVTPNRNSFVNQTGLFT